MLDVLRGAVRAQGETSVARAVQHKDAAGAVYSEFDKTLYAADKAFCKAKMAARAAAQMQGALASP